MKLKRRENFDFDKWFEEAMAKYDNLPHDDRYADVEKKIEMFEVPCQYCARNYEEEYCKIPCDPGTWKRFFEYKDTPSEN